MVPVIGNAQYDAIVVRHVPPPIDGGRRDDRSTSARASLLLATSDDGSDRAMYHNNVPNAQNSAVHVGRRTPPLPPLPNV